MLTPEQFRERIEDFLAKSGMKPTNFGIEAVNDPSFVPDVLRGGRVPSLAVAGRVIEFIEAKSRDLPEASDLAEAS